MVNMLAVAKDRLRQGRPDIAEAICADLAAAVQDDAEVLHIYGLALLAREGPAPRATKALKRAVDQRPDDPNLKMDLAIACLRQGDAQSARAAMQTVVAEQDKNQRAAALQAVIGIVTDENLPSDDVIAGLADDDLRLIAQASVLLKRADKALTALAGMAAAERAESLPTLARALASAGELTAAVDTAAEYWAAAEARGPFDRRMLGAEAEAICRALETMLLDYRPRHVLLARVLLDTTDQFHEGVRLLNADLERGNSEPEALAAGGMAYVRQGEFADALSLLDRARSRHPDGRAIAHVHAAALWADERTGDPPPAILSTNELMVLANGLCVKNHLDRAAEVLQCAVDRDPLREDTWIMLGDVLSIIGRFAEAENAVTVALDIHPVEPKASVLRATLALHRGDQETGWRLYENRFKYWRRDTPPRRFRAPRWAGDPGCGRTLMVWREEGVGDEIRFAGCLRTLSGFGFSRVIFECAPRLVSLFSRSFPQLEIRGEGGDDQGEDYDVQIPLFSLPGLLRPHIENYEDAGAYLSADRQSAKLYRRKLADLGPAPRVGVCWKSLNASWMKQPFHSELSDWAPILDAVDATFINLQVDVDQVGAQHSRIHDIEDLDLRNDIDGAAAVISELNAVVSARCWVPILSGALGVPTFCFSAPFNPFFFGQVRDPWMSAVRIYTSLGLADWSGPMTAIAADLPDVLSRLR